MSRYATRRCSRCGLTLDLNEHNFHRDTGNASGYHYYCKSCRCIVNAMEYVARRERAIAAGWRPWESTDASEREEQRIQRIVGSTAIDAEYAYSAFHGPVYPSRQRPAPVYAPRDAR